MDDVLDRRMRRWWPERWFDTGSTLNTPPLDVYEEGDDVVVKTELPGLDKDDVEVNLTDHTLVIKGEKRKEEEAEQGNYYRSERAYESFARTVQLSTEVQPDKVKATFRN
jgi:HSP20 family protein